MNISINMKYYYSTFDEISIEEGAFESVNDCGIEANVTADTIGKFSVIKGRHLLVKNKSLKLKKSSETRDNRNQNCP